MRTKACLTWVVALCAVSVYPGSASADNGRVIFRCELNGVPTFSDRPCASAAEHFEPDPIATNTYDPPPSHTGTRRAAVKPGSRKRAAAPAIDPNKHKETCERLAERLKDTRSKQRAGYKAREGERLNERQARLKSQLRSARCS
jgi:hypothetical protein